MKRALFATLALLFGAFVFGAGQQVNAATVTPAQVKTSDATAVQKVYHRRWHRPYGYYRPRWRRRYGYYRPYYRRRYYRPYRYYRRPYYRRRYWRRRYW